ncbi:unnamed protein product [Nezara viridula]|uniref:Uncharacterized protein n=1 Tax=Nezara viridula TaxID=85310 RepID=A0A9P0MRS5_NEZVI|nr:unnamed protein product [Nezara viridula]
MDRIDECLEGQTIGKNCNKGQRNSSQSVVGKAEPKETSLVENEPRRERPDRNTEQAAILGGDDGWPLC